KLDCNRKQVERVHRHPTCAIRLFDVAAGRQRRAAVEDTDVVESKKAALEDVHSFSVFPINPPGEVQHQLVKDFFEEPNVAYTASLFLDLVNTPCRPRMHRRIHIAEGPFIGRQLSIWVHVPFAKQEHELLFGEIGIDKRERDTVEGKVPCCIPGVLPFVRHRDHISVVEVSPIGIAALEPLAWRRRLRWISLKPLSCGVVVELLGPQKSCNRLSYDVLAIQRQVARYYLCVEVIGFLLSENENLIKVCVERISVAVERIVGKAKFDPDGLAGPNLKLIMPGSLRASLFRIYSR